MPFGNRFLVREEVLSCQIDPFGGLVRIGKVVVRACKSYRKSMIEQL